MPTLLELAGATAIPANIDGISFAPTLRGQAQPERPFLYREFPAYGGQQAIWSGTFKAIRVGLNPPAAQTGARKKAEPRSIALYDLATDPTESKNLAQSDPQKLEDLVARMRQEHTPSRDFPFRTLDAEVQP